MHISQMVDRIDLKLGEHVSIIPMHLPIKNLGQWVHEYQEKLKMDIGDGGPFLEKCAQEFVEIS